MAIWDRYVAVVGGVNMDIGGQSFAKLVAGDSNPGTVCVSLGGVGRNIAHNLRLLGTDVRFLTAFGDDVYAQRIEASCAELGIDISCALKVPGEATPTYLYLNDSDGDMALAVSDMEICERITPKYLEANLDILNGARAVVADANIPEASAAYLAEHCRAPVFADPVSTRKAAKLKPVLGKIHTLKPNRMEAELLSGIRITDGESLRKAARALLDTGLKQVFISLGKDGLYAAGQEGERIQPCCPARVRNTTGAGDAFMAALVWAWMEGKDLADTCRAAAAAAAVATESAETINPAMSAGAVAERMARMKEKE